MFNIIEIKSSSILAIIKILIFISIPIIDKFLNNSRYYTAILAYIGIVLSYN